VRFQLGQADRFRAGLQRAGVWESHIAATLAAAGIPEEIAVLPHVESSFQPAAMSKAGAAGLWQFIRSTGRRFLRIDRAVDERFDPDRATEAAAQLLTYNYRVLGTWPLAITAYNHGAAGMRRAREQLGTDDIVQIVRYYHSPSFGFASRNYYASFLAALRLDRDPEKYFGAFRRLSAPATVELPLPDAIGVDALAHALNVPAGALRDLNPALRSPVWSQQRPIPRGYRLRLPGSHEDWSERTLAQRLTERGGESAVLVANVPHAGGAHGGRAGSADRRGTAQSSAVAAAVAAAPAPAPAVEVVPSATPAVAGGTASGFAATGPASLAPGQYLVRPGDSLASIALAAGLAPELLMRMNGLSDDISIYEGQRLTLATASGGTAAELVRSAEADHAEEVQSIAAANVAPTPVTESQAAEQGPALVPDAGAPPSADPIDYSVRADNTLIVVAAETIGHYADWLQVPTASLRVLNRMHGHSTVLMGRRLKLVFGKVTREQFERKRRDYHQQLQTDYFAAHRIVGSSVYVARRGDSLWSVTQRGALPVWLLQQYNPDLDFTELRPGTQIVLPQVEAAS
jgi:membrane-bound lytic murein transglycosylase D